MILLEIQISKKFHYCIVILSFPCKWTWESNEYFVKYVADENGYRVVESNVVPATHSGELADGNQVNFSDEEYGDDVGEGGDDLGAGGDEGIFVDEVTGDAGGDTAVQEDF